jgi:hypothetical protein
MYRPPRQKGSELTYARAGESVCGAGVSHGGSGSPIGRGGSLRCQDLPLDRGLSGRLWWSAFMKIPLLLGLAFILLLLLLILMFVGFALL